MTSRKRIPGKVLSPLFGIIAALLLLGSGITTALTYQFLKTATKTEGTITKIDRAGNHPIVGYQTQDGKAVTFSLRSSIRLKTYKIGDRVAVLYQANNFGGYRSHIDTVGSIWIEPIVFTGLFASFTIASLYMRNSDK